LGEATCGFVQLQDTASRDAETRPPQILAGSSHARAQRADEREDFSNEIRTI
jgi:hypothetical protein